MSEKTKKEELPPIASPEQQRLFKITLANLLKLSQSGQPLMVDNQGGAIEKDFAEAMNIDFTENAVGNKVHAPIENGTTSAGWVAFYGGDAVKKTGAIASLALQPDIFDHTQQDIWTLYPDSNVGLEKFTILLDEELDPSSDDFGKFRTEFDHWLSDEEIEGLGNLIDSLLPGWPNSSQFIL